MRIAITADLHLGITRRDTVQMLATKIGKTSPDTVVLAGDIAETAQDPALFEKCVSIFTQAMPNIPVLVIPGNHDLWTSDGDSLSSLDLWEHRLKEMTQAAGGFWLEEETWRHDGIAIVGSMLHYDFSAQDKVGATSTYPKEFFIANKSRIINDGRFFVGLPDDIAFAKRIGDQFRLRLIQAQDDPGVRSIVVVTHVPCMESQITRKPNDYNWSLATPFFGNLSHVDLLTSCDKITHIISAHNHNHSKAHILTSSGSISVTTIGSNYGKPTSATVTV